MKFPHTSRRGSGKGSPTTGLRTTKAALDHTSCISPVQKAVQPPGQAQAYHDLCWRSTLKFVSSAIACRGFRTLASMRAILWGFAGLLIFALAISIGGFASCIAFEEQYLNLHKLFVIFITAFDDSDFFICQAVEFVTHFSPLFLSRELPRAADL